MSATRLAGASWLERYDSSSSLGSEGATRDLEVELSFRTAYMFYVYRNYPITIPITAIMTIMVMVIDKSDGVIYIRAYMNIYIHTYSA